MRKQILLKLLTLSMLAAAGCGTNATPKRVSPPASTSKTNGGKHADLRVVAIGGETPPDAASAPIVKSEELFHVRATYRTSDTSERGPPGLIYIVRKENGRDVVYNSAPSERKREGSVVIYEGDIKAQPVKGEFRLEIVDNNRALVSSPLTVE